MSTLAYAFLTNQRDDSKPDEPTGINRYVDAMAALVPTEVLLAHAVILDATTRVDETADPWITRITDPDSLEIGFYALMGFAFLFFVVPRVTRWKKADFLRMTIPPAAFGVWTMLQKTTAFDAIASGSELTEAERTVFGVLAALSVTLIAGALAMTAERSEPGREDTQNTGASRELLEVDEAV